MKRIRRENINGGPPDRWPEPAASVSLGESIIVETEMFNKVNGPIYIEGINPGNTMIVTIEDIKLVGDGIANNGGPLRKGEEVPIRIEDNCAIFPSDIKVPIDPMIGVIGVFPAPDDDITDRIEKEAWGWRAIMNNPPSKHGGNMDCPAIHIGSRVYFNAQVEGGMLCLADIHAIQGDGEISGTGVEIASEVKLKVEKSTKLESSWPLVETDTEIMAVVTGQSYSLAAKEAVGELVNAVMRLYDLTFEQANLLVVTIGDLKNCSIWMLNNGYLPDTDDLPPGDLTLRAVIKKLPLI